LKQTTHLLKLQAHLHSENTFRYIQYRLINSTLLLSAALNK